ncbi:MAG TPA: hypothetical protein VK541_01605 [Pedobacter sp.]|uniref:hypothetical protein n=1 Tax=Pedobacter sp. TaxID=1411316 RepID=UPI002C41C9E9|nr:hypothetical protein [Pedobacter sp.]HMI01144.1 hypothetical protein [Pedobacter sp.]
MNWDEVKVSIVKDLESRDLKDPTIRIGALNSIDKILVRHIEELRSNPIKFIELFKKDDFKALLATYKSNKKLNGAEESVVNEIYTRL